jgi:hypothetical protein
MLQGGRERKTPAFGSGKRDMCQGVGLVASCPSPSKVCLTQNLWQLEPRKMAVTLLADAKVAGAGSAGSAPRQLVVLVPVLQTAPPLLPRALLTATQIDSSQTQAAPPVTIAAYIAGVRIRSSHSRVFFPSPKKTHTDSCGESGDGTSGLPVAAQLPKPSRIGSGRRLIGTWDCSFDLRFV